MAEAAETERRSSAPEGALCATHPDAPASLVCERCGRFACVACVSDDGATGDAGRTCRECRAKAPLLLGRASWSWVLGWVFATLAGMAAAFAVGTLNQRLHGDTPPRLWAIVAVLCGAVAFSAAQALALSRLKKDAWHWMVVTALPVVASMVGPDIARSALGLDTLATGAVSVALVALTPTLAQWLLVRRWVERAWLWIPSCLLGLVVGYVLGDVLSRVLFRFTGSLPGNAPAGQSLAVVSAMMLPYALVQGLLLRGLRRKQS